MEIGETIYVTTREEFREWLNQTAFGNAGKRNGLPPNPSDNPNGSFHSPNPHVPAIELLEAFARRLRLKV